MAAKRAYSDCTFDTCLGINFYQHTMIVNPI